MIAGRLQQQVVTARHQLDEAIAELWHSCREQGRDLYCRAGCGNCCTLAVNCSYPEAMILATSLTAQQREQILTRLALMEQLSTTAIDLKDFLQSYRTQMKGCPLLDGKSCCSCYANRPLSCRALLSTRPATWCGVDFATLHPLEKQAFLSSLDPEVVAYPSHYLAKPLELAATLERKLDEEFAAHFQVKTSGNLIWLLGLELRSQVSERLARREEGMIEWLLQQEEQYPFLMQVAAF